MPYEIDPTDRLPTLGEFFGELAGAACAEPARSPDGVLFVREIALDLPFELDLLEESGAWQLDASPPTQKIETTIMPVWHRVRIRVRVDDGERGLESVES